MEQQHQLCQSMRQEYSFLLRYESKVKTESLGVLTGKHCINYSTEAQALQTAASSIQTASSEYYQVVFLTDAPSILGALSNNKEPQLMDTPHKSTTKNAGGTADACSLRDSQEKRLLINLQRWGPRTVNQPVTQLTGKTYHHQVCFRDGWLTLLQQTSHPFLVKNWS